MTANSPDDLNIAHSIEISRKFEYYFIALVFTLLAVAIQSFPSMKINLNWQNYFEFGGWASLILSGISGLSRLENLPGVYFYAGERNKTNIKINLLSGDKNVFDPDASKMWKADEVKKELHVLKNNVSLINNCYGKLMKTTHMEYQLHRWAFIVGLFLIFISRGLTLFAVHADQVTKF